MSGTGPTIDNAVISSVQIGKEHGLWTVGITIRDASSSQGYGGLNCNPPGAGDECLGAWIKGICEVIGVESWVRLVGTPCRIERNAVGRIRRVGHYLEEKWFDQSALSK